VLLTDSFVDAEYEADRASGGCSPWCLPGRRRLGERCGHQDRRLPAINASRVLVSRTPPRGVQSRAGPGRMVALVEAALCVASLRQHDVIPKRSTRPYAGPRRRCQVLCDNERVNPAVVIRSFLGRRGTKSWAARQYRISRWPVRCSTSRPDDARSHAGQCFRIRASVDRKLRWCRLSERRTARHACSDKPL
jgi:hypothetical protein